jgi:hypothetical protein
MIPAILGIAQKVLLSWWAANDLEADLRALTLAGAAQNREPVAPCLLMVGGIIASRKSTVAERIGDLLSAPVIDADRTRKAIPLKPALRAGSIGFGDVFRARRSHGRCLAS